MAVKKTTKDEGISLDYAALSQIIWADVKQYLKSNEENFRPKKYTREQIRRFMATPDTYERQLREVSQYLMITNSHYRRLIGYFSTMLTFDYIVSPLNRTSDEVSATGNEVFRRNYERSLKYMENFNIKHELSKISKILWTEGVYFGYERQVGNSFMIQRLPTNYCKIIGIEDGTYVFAFNFDYFIGKNIELFPEEFKALSRVAQSSGLKWQELDSDKSVCLKFDEDTISYSIPPFTGIYEDILDLEDFKDLQKQKTKIDNYKILVQRIPMKKDPKSEKDYVLTLDTVRTMHSGIKSALPEVGVGIISTPMDVTGIDFGDKARTREDTVGQATRNLFDSAGVTMALFNAQDSGSIGVNRSIEMDAAFCFPLLKQIERFMRRRLNQINTNTYPFKAIFPDLTIYNRLEMFDKYLEAAQYGFPKSFIAASLGIQIGDLVALSAFEDKFLNLQDLLIPLVSSHTATADSVSGSKGRPKKDSNKLSDSGAQTRDKNKNANRAK